MKKLCGIVFLIVFFAFEVNSQQLIGQYFNKEHGEELNFISKKEVEFNLNSGTCLNLIYAGKGNYRKYKNHIIIQPNRPENLPQSVEKVKKTICSDTSLVVRVFDNNGVLIAGATVVLMKNNRMQVGTVTDENGCAVLKYSLGIKDVELRCSYIGFAQVSYIIGENKYDFNVHLEELPSFDGMKKFCYNAGKGLEIKIQKDALLIKRLKPHCDQNDSCYEWREYLKVEK